MEPEDAVHLATLDFQNKRPSLSEKFVNESSFFQFKYNSLLSYLAK